MATKTWQNGGVNNLYSTAGNWVEGSKPAAGDDVVIAAAYDININEATAAVKSWDMTGYSNTMSGASTITVRGLTATTQSCIIAGTITWTGTLTFSFVSTSSDVALTTNANRLTAIVLQGSGADLILQDNLTMTAVKTASIQLSSTAGAKINLNGFTISGDSSVNRVHIRTNTIGSDADIIVNSGTFANADFRDITLDTSTDLSAITGLSGDCGGNTNITFTTAASQGLTMSTSKSWSDATIWTSRVPLPQDDVTVTSWTGGLLTGDMPRLGKSIDFTGAAGTGFSWSSGITIYGSLTLDAGMGTISNGATGGLFFEGRSSFTLTTAGKNLQTGGVTLGFDMVGGTMTLMDALSSTGAFARLTQGTFDADTYNVTVSTWTTSSGTTTDLGTGTWTFAGSTSPIWSMNASANVTAGSSTIALTNTSSSNYTFAGGGKTYNDLTITGGGTGIRTFSGSNTFNTFTIGGPKTVTFTAGTTQTITDFVRSVGTDVITLQSSSAGTAATLAKTSAIKEQLDYLTITDVNVTPASTWYYGFNSTYNSGTGWNAGAGVSNLMLLGVG